MKRKTPNFPAIYNAIRRADLPDADRLDLLRALQDLKSVTTMVRKPAKNKVQAKTTALGARRRYKPDPRIKRHAGDPCSVCKQTLPHSTRDEWRAHMRAMCRRKGTIRGLAHWRKRGFEDLYMASARMRTAAALATRVKVFEEIAPRVANRLGRQAVERIVNSHRSSRTGSFYPFKQFRRWVEIHYGTR